MSQQEPRKRNKGGRPRKGEKPKFPYNEVDDLLVKGEMVVYGEGDGVKVVYPTYVEIAKRYNVSRSTISDFATKRNCKRRRQELHEKVKVKPKHKLRDYQDEDVDFTRSDVLRIIKKWLMRFEEAVEEGSVRFDNPSDLNTLARLQEFLTGHAESRKEIHNAITLEQIQERHMAQLKIIENTTPGERGEVVERTIEGTVERTAGGIDCRLPPAKPSEEPFAKETNRYLNTRLVSSIKPSKESNRYHNTYKCPHCGGEIRVEDVDDTEDRCIEVDTEVIETDPGWNSDDNYGEKTSQTLRKPEHIENIDELTDQPDEPQTESEELEDAAFESIDTAIEPTDDTIIDSSDTANKLASGTVELTDTTFEQASSSKERPNTHFDDVNRDDSPESQPTNHPTPELPLLYKSGNSSSEHDNDYE